MKTTKNVCANISREFALLNNSNTITKGEALQKVLDLVALTLLTPIMVSIAIVLDILQTGWRMLWKN